MHRYPTKAIHLSLLRISRMGILIEETRTFKLHRYRTAEMSCYVERGLPCIQLCLALGYSTHTSQHLRRRRISASLSLSSNHSALLALHGPYASLLFLFSACMSSIVNLALIDTSPPSHRTKKSELLSSTDGTCSCGNTSRSSRREKGFEQAGRRRSPFTRSSWSIGIAREERENSKREEPHERP